MVDEAFPFHMSAAAEAEDITASSLGAMKDNVVVALPSADEMEEPPGVALRHLEQRANEFAVRTPDDPANDATPLPSAAAGPQVVSARQFREADVLHRASGSATV